MNKDFHYFNEKYLDKDLEIILSYMLNLNKKEVKEKLNTDMLLDQYNDYMTLYKMFGDKEYKEKAEEVMTVLRKDN